MVQVHIHRNKKIWILITSGLWSTTLNGASFQYQTDYGCRYTTQMMKHKPCMVAVLVFIRPFPFNRFHFPTEYKKIQLLVCRKSFLSIQRIFFRSFLKGPVYTVQLKLFFCFLFVSFTNTPHLHTWTLLEKRHKYRLSTCLNNIWSVVVTQLNASCLLSAWSGVDG